MEQLLRGQKISEIEEAGAGEAEAEVSEIEKAVCPGTEYDLSGPVLYFPIRHHSPVCSYHLQKAAEAYRPDCILIEGPENAEPLIPILVHEDTKPPLALYYAYQDKEGLISPDREDYKCYYLFLACSPELTALKEADRRGIHVEFMDLPYAEILAGTMENRGIRKEGEKQNYSDDYLLSRSRYFAQLCEKTGVREFEEFWEKYFEIQGLFQETPEFVHQMLLYCGLSRLYTPGEELEEDGCALRERYMAEQIARASETYQRILVVTGGFHTYGLGKLLEKKKGAAGLCFVGEPVRLHRIDPELQSVYPMAYSMEAADALNGYASGMQSPGFYHQVWKRLEAGLGAKEAWEDTILHFLALTGKKARGREESVSAYDEICAFSMAQGLAALRGKRCPGLYELRDSALSSFVKGEYSISTDGALRILAELTTGTQTGALCADAMRPPLLADFEKQCVLFGLKLHSTMEQESVLEIFAKEKHLRLSRFFYQTEFLSCGFARRKKGSDLVNRRDRSRMREIWSYRWSARVTAALIDASVSGASVEEAARTLLHKRFSAASGCREAAKLLVESFLMGLLDEQDQMGARLSQIVSEDGDFFSLSGGFSQLVMLAELQDLYQARGKLNLENMIGSCFQKIIQLLPFMGQTKEERQQECMESLRTLYQVSGKPAYAELQPVFLAALERMLERRPVNPAIEGAALGLLYGFDGSFGVQISAAARGYMQGTKEVRAASAAFLQGLFFTARDFALVSREFLQLIDGLLASLSAEEFMSLLPELRLAFGYFTPLETDRIAGQAAVLHGKTGRELLRGRSVSLEAYACGEALDSYAARRMERSPT
ncbi:MAG: DUF5682 family protein [Candidatus Merdisoma sp.]|jgi:hypothetical protein